MQGLLGEICEKPYYNFTIFMGVSSRDRASCMNDPVKKCVSMGRAIALGGKLTEFDPCNVSAAISSRVRGVALPLGHGFACADGEAASIVVPLAEVEDE